MEKGRKRTNGWASKPDQPRLEKRHKFGTVKAISHWNKLPEAVVDSPSLAPFRSRQAAFLKDTLAKHELLGSRQGQLGEILWPVQCRRVLMVLSGFKFCKPRGETEQEACAVKLCLFAQVKLTISHRVQGSPCARACLWQPSLRASVPTWREQLILRAEFCGCHSGTASEILPQPGEGNCVV